MPSKTMQRPDLDSLPADALLDAEQVALVLSCCTRHVYRMSVAGQLPAPLRIGQLFRWRVGTLRSFLRRDAGGSRGR
jgi:predicted DNA-binding transcriptional regulator AlpA